MNPFVVIPWRGGDPLREASFEYVTGVLTGLGLPWLDVDSDVWLDEEPGPFNRARAKNLGAEIAIADGYDVLVFHDADMLLEPERYDILVQQAVETRKLVIGFTEYRALSQSGSAWVVRGQLSDPWQAGVDKLLTGFSVGGVIAITTERFVEVGGYDERFRGWGCEDWAFQIACSAVCGPSERLAGSAVHFWHEHGSATQAVGDEEFNARLLSMYSEISNADDLRRVQQMEV